jgi:catechol 2,3-dioxygenase-like lactoylglutathione lyase family enzyme
MSEGTRATTVTQVGTVMLPVADQDRAIEFYTEKLGFEKRADTPFGNGDRWVEVAPVVGRDHGRVGAADGGAGGRGRVADRLQQP